MGASTLSRGISGGRSPAALDGTSPQARGIRVSGKPFAIVCSQPGDAPQPLEGSKCLAVKVFQEVDDFLGDGMLASSQLGLVIGQRVAKTVVGCERTAVAAQQDADGDRRGVGRHPHDGGGLEAGALHVVEEQAKHPGQGAFGGAGPSAAGGNGINARLAVAEEPATGSRKRSGLENRPSLGPGDVSHITRGSTAGGRDDVPGVIEHHE